MQGRMRFVQAAGRVNMGVGVTHPPALHKHTESQENDGQVGSRAYRGGENFAWGQLRHTSNVGAGPPDMGNSDTPNPWFLVDNQLCETLVRVVHSGTVV